ncbi:MAG: aldo/keto reductase [Planctomycetota bacterium]
MQYTKLNGIDLPVSRLAFGCMSTVASQTYPGLAEQQAVDTIRAAFDAGINFFDTARAYGDGESEELLGKALADVRDKVVIASKPKAGDLSESEVLSECEHSLKSLGTDFIDLYQIHWPKRVVPLEETVRAMEKLVQQGKVRTIGVCNFGPLDLEEWLGIGPVITNQFAYSLIARGPEFGTQQACVEHDIGILCYSPIAQGLLAGAYEAADDVPSGKARTRHFRGDRPEARHGEPGCESATFAALRSVRDIAESIDRPMADVAIAWLLSRPGVTAALVGASTAKSVQRNIAAADLQLSQETIDRLDAATEEVKQKMGPSIDMWASPPRTR